MRHAVLAAALVGTCALGAGPATAADKVMVFVEEFTVQKPVAEKGASFASVFCTNLSKDARVEVVCAPDVKQMMEFAALSGMMGNQGNNANALEKRLGKVDVIVRADVRKGKYGLILDVDVYQRDANFGGMALNPGAKLGGIKKLGLKDGATGVMNQLPELAQRVGALAADPASSKDATPPEKL